MEIKDYNVMIDGTNVFDLRMCDNIQKIATDQGDDYTTSCLIDFFNMITIDLKVTSASF